MLRRFPSFAGSFVFALMLASVGCGGTQASAPSQEAPAVIDVAVTSGVPQPPPKDVSVGVGTPVTLRIEGLGPARATVFGPDGARVPTTDAPLLREQHAAGTEHRFTPQVPGTYRVEHAEVPGLELAKVTAK